MEKSCSCSVPVSLAVESVWTSQLIHLLSERLRWGVAPAASALFRMSAQFCKNRFWICSKIIRSLKRVVYVTVLVYCVYPSIWSNYITKRTQQSEAKPIKPSWTREVLNILASRNRQRSRRLRPKRLQMSRMNCSLLKRVLLRGARPVHSLLQQNTGTLFYIASVSSKSLNTCWFWFNCSGPVHIKNNAPFIWFPSENWQ